MLYELIFGSVCSVFYNIYSFKYGWLTLYWVSCGVLA